MIATVQQIVRSLATMKTMTKDMLNFDNQFSSMTERLEDGVGSDIEERIAGFIKKWKMVTMSPDLSSFSIIIGDYMQVLMNGRFKSVRHRVVINKLSLWISMMY